MKALELAKWNQAMADEPKRAESKRTKHAQTASELRRLAEVNAELLYVLEEVDATLEMEGYSDLGPTRTMIRENMAKAKEQQ